MGTKSAWNWITLWASLMFVVILGFSRLSYGMFLPGIQREIGGSYGQLGILGTVNFVGYLIGTLCLSPILSRFPDRKPIINRITCLLLGLTMIGSASSQHFIQLGLWRFAIGLLSAIATVLVLSIAMDAVRPAERGAASGLIWLGGSAGILVTGLFAPFTIDPSRLEGWRYAWAGMGAFGVIAAVGFEYAARRREPAAEPSGAEADSKDHERMNVYRLLLHPKKLLFLIGSYFFFGWGYIIYFTYLIPYLVSKGIPSLDAGLVWSGIGAAGLFNGWIGGKAIDRWPSGYTLAAGLTLGTIGVFGVTTGSMIGTAAGAITIGLVSFITPPLMTTALLRRHVPHHANAACLSLATACFASGQIIGPIVGGAAVGRYGLQFGVASSAIFMAIAALLAGIYGHGQRREHRQRFQQSQTSQTRQ
ncbi:YbfB/YjiJ family MFS transporter [Paenibacillus sacheonensis]|uniref:YbfB/YjiJ family MFS transporter n=1 Tax=Paenibacillus sacheonensis TaxID=742054 RepID=A0A7X4YQL5_9BACL|nr:YbfB/YjiJ family MFS transporter [Paenibacillus sacheonensis]MBM7567861.1 putative MFS family arabinose efflux permease [Paenibacillus sacheonensis]NBC70747.1 YbfB/YjiJ family MFS transporter [Paenibacillus sacheonensis]